MKTSTNTQSKYAQKRASGNMMYGPAPVVPKHPSFKADCVHHDYYWWGEERAVNHRYSRNNAG